MCKAWAPGSSTSFGSGEVANQPNAKDRFEYHARKYGESISKQIFTDCVDFELISAKYRNSFEPGGSYLNYRGEPWTVVAAPFLPPNWESTPTPEEKAKTSAKASDRAGKAAAPIPPGKSQAEVAAEERAARAAAREEAFQAKQAAYERDLAEQKRKVDEFERAEAEVARLKAEQQAKADAVMEAFRKQSEAHAAVMRKHQQDTANYQSEIGNPGSAGPVEDLGMRKFQATGAIRNTRDQAMASLMAHPHSATLTDVRCDQIKGFDNEWTCWGFYLQKVTRSGASKQ